LKSNIYLKLENLQPSGSFKSRGIGNLMFRAMSDAACHTPNVHFYCSSGGNAGLACATSAVALGCKVTIAVPVTTPSFMVDKLRALGVDVRQVGANWSAADAYLRNEAMAKHDPTSRAVYVPPFDHPDIWTGAASLVDELAAQMGSAGPSGTGIAVDAIVCNVGGGGLLCGIMEGLDRNRKRLVGADTRGLPRVLAIETVGADALRASVLAGEMVTLPSITSIATSLGATRVAEKAFEWTQKASDRLITSTVTDADGVMGVVNFLRDARMFVEVACGATIATVYNGELRRQLGKTKTDEDWANMNVVLVVCGGSNINLDLLQQYREKYLA
jgi:L-serine/L-threonine ammonia-lyase